MPEFSRRAALMQLGAAGLAAMTPGAAISQNPFASFDAKPWAFLTPDEARFLAALSDVLIPQDAFPSASQAGVVDFIDLQLAGPYGKGADLYLQGPFGEATPEQGYQAPYPPATLIREGIARFEASGTRLADLDASGREDVARRLSEGEGVDLGDVPAQTLFDEIWSLVKEGYFADPIYGGNKDYAGWRMVGFPGAHAYYTDFIGRNAPYRAPPRGIAHVPGRSRSASPARGRPAAPIHPATEEG
ncbi:gluconate 2-dehydrogenase subunit 3 family protein [Poseidonocella sedimentorum]|uniref:Gluconate 2-dehydrogenase gamma chain n=1 Tax=Poseidonocella sedimentorum TaxID=871652 RepID=A0A1I6CV15_9RHOB|nr:gluconate 2-dehydrogenase subunit 3 family protein [Poseidonocella sedimentorum]SFQ97069.1 gluconate 2-dehydrogenase gamma chain [Poseidonocella sedimentorum]